MSSTPVQYLPELSSDVCQRCKDLPAVLVSRKEKFCAKCFIWFMRGKQRKQMLDDRYKVKYGAIAERLGVQRVLLPLSFGVSSLVLFDMIASLLQEQNLMHKGKQGFELVVVHLQEDQQSRSELFQALAGNYTPVSIQYVEVDLDLYPVDTRVRLAVSPEFDVVADADVSRSESVAQLLEKSASRSLKADLRGLIYEEIFNNIAVREQCETLLYGHSMTRLANEVIALTVKGRGLRIHEAVADRTSSYMGKDLHVIFPLRDILFAEVKAVLKLSDGLSKYAVLPVAQGPRPVKNMTVHDLTTQYFDGLDATGYASTASTVVKTAEKLGGPRSEAPDLCQVCGAAIHHNPRAWLQNITVNSAAPLNTDEEREYAREYRAHSPENATGKDLLVCYGCTVTMAGAGDGFIWPVRATKEEILGEYVLTDESDDE
ncbi:hypothetical protein METBIDRAFT_36535 [Metschnikowia bicuspidata var. bicuspidata NRRL YB-4993]|uniref:Cytoplasmic tRNA 2-thiolation protein 2 n=1 Tax=Metschnikowia bicuspidata var. bicuspidata NRRL YB-4993 TaxID=869754 RepID=A0A1A0HIC2_9ASCO|nr:hypothetical protein METBIDRAFT_36535 [Metschnikowia bicuspidata var. bicuspidata NRRL YB-4993]OBA23588.1 hypothetical protein METBIDRAFT_36535 [Metschnikowia bicuspidata var. bicuspidata NRRL YB-4993]